MSLFALPVNVSDLTALQQGIEFSTDTTEATAKAAAINSGAETVFAYAAELIDANLPYSQVAMATRRSCLATLPRPQYSRISH